MLLTALGMATPACLSRPIETVEPHTTTTVNLTLPQSRVDKIDLLLVVDDSGSMGDKQQILAAAVPDLVDSLVNPPCLDADGQIVAEPAQPLEACPAESRREFEPVLDIHIGIISTSLGSKNDDNCNNDLAHLPVSTPTEPAQDTFENKGFLVWSPEAEAATAGRYTTAQALNDDLAQMVTGVGQDGCGFEHVLESWYRFLVEPDPYATIDRVDNKNVPEGTDDELLAQRAGFLRADSLVAVVMLSDENDCSFRADGYGYWTGNAGIMSLKARKECATEPNDPCCAPCGYEPEACPTDPTCGDDIPDENLLRNLTCFDQKRRFGIDFRYPVERYIDGLTKVKISDRHGQVVDNPLLVAPDGTVRSEDRVFLSGIVGVPWQTIARDSSDLREGFQDARELAENGTWAKILGDPDANVPPADPHMVESIYPREGIAGTGGAVWEDPINGHEYDVQVSKPEGQPRPSGDLQYACIFDLPEPFDCQDSSCDCGNPEHSQNNPLCQAPDQSYGSMQYRAKAYPGLRQLSVLEGIGTQGIVGSICPAQVVDAASPDYGYRPAIQALIERLKEQLEPPCLSRSLSPATNGQVACIVVEGRELPDGDSCDCDYAAARVPVAAEHQSAVSDAKASLIGEASEISCFCEIEQLADEQLATCKNSLDDDPQLNGEPVDGWCYVDPDVVDGGNDQLVAHCPATKKQTIRFVGEGEPVNDALMFITCHQSS